MPGGAFVPTLVPNLGSATVVDRKVLIEKFAQLRGTESLQVLINSDFSILKIRV